jgi:putative endonuclease
MALTRERGQAGEALAVAYLQLKGCRLVARNAKLAGVEVDVVVDEDATRVLVEVRLRSRGDFGGAAASIDHRKQQRLVRAARALEQQGITRVRIDVIAVDLAPDGATLTHYRNAVSD